MELDKPDFILLDHTGDLGIIVHGTDPKDLFEEAAKSMTYIMVRGKTDEKAKSVKLSVPGHDMDDLMVRWLGEILYLFEGEKKVITDVEIDVISPFRLDARLKTIYFDPNLLEIINDIKAVTYHQIEVTKKGDRWESRIIFDL